MLFPFMWWCVIAKSVGGNDKHIYHFLNFFFRSSSNRITFSNSFCYFFLVQRHSWHFICISIAKDSLGVLSPNISWLMQHLPSTRCKNDFDNTKQNKTPQKGGLCPHIYSCRMYFNNNRISEHWSSLRYCAKYFKCTISLRSPNKLWCGCLLHFQCTGELTKP